MYGLSRPYSNLFRLWGTSERYTTSSLAEPFLHLGVGAILFPNSTGIYRFQKFVFYTVITPIDFNVLVLFYDRYLCFIIIYYFLHSYRKVVYNIFKNKIMKNKIMKIEINGITVYMAIYSTGRGVDLSKMCLPVIQQQKSIEWGGSVAVAIMTLSHSLTSQPGLPVLRLRLKDRIGILLVYCPPHCLTVSLSELPGGLRVGLNTSRLVTMRHFNIHDEARVAHDFMASMTTMGLFQVITGPILCRQQPWCSVLFWVGWTWSEIGWLVNNSWMTLIFILHFWLILGRQ